jgi:hypothetical protein
MGRFGYGRSSARQLEPFRQLGIVGQQLALQLLTLLARHRLDVEPIIRNQSLERLLWPAVTT